MKFNGIVSLCVIVFLTFTKSDVPVHCRKEQIQGEWIFHINKETFNPDISNEQTTCGHGFPNHLERMTESKKIKPFEKEEKHSIRLGDDYQAYSNNSKKGTWTPVYDQGFILNYSNMELFANMQYIQDLYSEGGYKSNCDATMIGWVIRDVKNKEKAWSCFYAIKRTSSNSMHFFIKNEINLKSKRDEFELNQRKLEEDRQVKKSLLYKDLGSIVEEINNAGLPWKAALNENFLNMNLQEINDFMGIKGRKYTPSSLPVKESSKLASSPSPMFLERKMLNMGSKVHAWKKQREVNSDKATLDQATKYIDKPVEEINIDELAENWDWTNVGGVSFIAESPPQGDCGSCYIFSTMGSLESRLRIMTKNKDKTQFSRQFVVSCNFYTEGCKGGFPILVAKFSHEFELIPNECFPYQARNVQCSNVCDYKKSSKKYKVKKFEYLGGFYGNTNEELMIKEIRARGPVPGHIKPNDDFSFYKTGIFTTRNLNQFKHKLKSSRATLLDKNITWEEVTHGILIVGYGVENGIKYWKCKNSWGDDWGENGFFKILRGVDEIGVESMGDAFHISVSNR